MALPDDDRARAPWWVRGAQPLVRRLPAGRFRAAAVLARLGSRPFVTTLPDALGRARFWCDLADEIARDASLAGSYEPQLTEGFRRLLAPGMTVIDVGANWGYFTLLAASLVGPSGNVLSLEPDPRLAELLVRNLALNDFRHVRLRRVAASNRAGDGWLQGYAEGAGNRGVSRLAEQGDGAMRVSTVPLDELLRQEAIASVDLIKLDIEGAELDALDGMQEGLAAGRYRHILLELHPALLAARGQTIEACCDRLRGAGYRGWSFDHRGAAHRRAAYAPRLRLEDLLIPGDRPVPGDPWPHMLWTRELQGVAGQRW